MNIAGMNLDISLAETEESNARAHHSHCRHINAAKSSAVGPSNTNGNANCVSEVYKVTDDEVVSGIEDLPRATEYQLTMYHPSSV